MASSTRWECIKKSSLLTNRPRAPRLQHAAQQPFALNSNSKFTNAASKIHTQSENAHWERLRSGVPIPAVIPGSNYIESQSPTLGLWSYWRLCTPHSRQVLWHTAPQKVVKHTPGWPGNGTACDWGFLNTWVQFCPQPFSRLRQLKALTPDYSGAVATPSKTTWEHL